MEVNLLRQKKKNLSSDEMKKSTFRKLIDKSLRFHHQDIHEELSKITPKGQAKSKFYYYFWGLATVAVVSGQIHIANGYNSMSKSVDNLVRTLSK